MKVLDRIALALVIIGALNSGAVGLFRFDCVAAIFGGQAAPSAASSTRWWGLPVCGASPFCSAMRPPRHEDNEKTAERRSFQSFRFTGSVSPSCAP